MVDSLVSVKNIDDIINEVTGVIGYNETLVQEVSNWVKQMKNLSIYADGQTKKFTNSENGKYIRLSYRAEYDIIHIPKPYKSYPKYDKEKLIELFNQG